MPVSSSSLFNGLDLEFGQNSAGFNSSSNQNSGFSNSGLSSAFHALQNSGNSSGGNSNGYGSLLRPNATVGANLCNLDVENSRTVQQLALELAMIQQRQGGPSQSQHQNSSHSPNNGSQSNGHHQQMQGFQGSQSHHHSHNHHMTSGSSSQGNLNLLLSDNPLIHPYSPTQGLLDGVNGGSLEDLKSSTRKSQNMTECVPVPSSEHVAEIVGRQGCKIKALRAKTNTYIKTPVRGEEPVFVVTGRREDVANAKREILSAADHFSQIRASRSKNAAAAAAAAANGGNPAAPNSTLAFGQLVANQPGQTTAQVRVPYRVVGLVVGPKGATIKRIQQTTHTYIVTPSRDKEPVFEVTGLPENVDAARKEIEAHIAIRTGNGAGNDGGMFGNFDPNGGSPTLGDEPNNAFSNNGSSSRDFGRSTSMFENGSSSRSGNGMSSMYDQHRSSGNNGGANGSSALFNDLYGRATNSLAGNSNGHGQNSASNGISMTRWSNNGGTDSHDSGIGHSPPFDRNGHHVERSHHNHNNANSNGFVRNDDNGCGIWGETLNSMMSSLDLNNGKSSSSANNNQLLSGILNDGQASSRNAQQNGGHHGHGGQIRSSLDLGTLGRPSALGSSSHMPLLAMSSTGSSGSRGDASPPLSLPYSSGNSSAAGGFGVSQIQGFGGVGNQQTVSSLLGHHRNSLSSEASQPLNIEEFSAESTAVAAVSAIFSPKAPADDDDVKSGKDE